MKKKVMVSAVLLMMIFSFSMTVSARNKRRLANGYMLDPTGTTLVSELAKFFRGYNRLKKTGSGCVSEAIRYREIGAEDKFYQWVVRKADQDGNHNGTAEYAELQAMWDTACANRGE